MNKHIVRFASLSGLVLAVSACGGSGQSSLGTSAPGAPNVVGSNFPTGSANPGGGTTTSITGEQASALADQALHDSLNSTPSTITVTETDTTITVQGTIDEGGATATIDVTITKHPNFSVDGTITISSGSDNVLVTIAGGQATVTIDGQPAGTFPSAVPVSPATSLAIAHDAIQQALTPGFTSSLTVTFTSPGQVTIDGTATCGQATVTFTNVSIDLMQHTINGTITVAAGGHTAVLAYAGTTVTVTIDGTVVGTYNLP